jgi:sugar lactone lactonase YvrE
MYESSRFFHFFGRRVVAAALFLCLYALAGPAAAQEEQQPQQPKDGRYYEAQARKAYQGKDYASFLENMKAAAGLRPNHPRLMFNLAAAYSLNNRAGEALEWLGRLAGMGLVFPAAADDDFTSIKSSDGFKTILQRIERNKARVGEGAPAFTLREKGFIPEGIAYDAATRTFYLGSVYRRKIVSVGADGEARDFATERDGLWSVLGMRVDAARRLLWVSTAAHRQMSNFKEEENGVSGLFKFDLRTGKLLKKYLLPGKPGRRLLGDLVINSRGDVFASDSVTPAVYVVARGRDELTPLVEGEPFTSPQGLALTRDEKRLFVADYSKGLFVIDLRTKKVTNLAPAPDVTLLGIDGLYTYKGGLLAVQNGVNPARLVRLFPDRGLSRIERLEVVEANNPAFDEPTLGVMVGDNFYLVANSQWGAIDEQGRLAPPEKLKEHVVLKIDLGARRSRE